MSFLFHQSQLDVNHDKFLAERQNTAFQNNHDFTMHDPPIVFAQQLIASDSQSDNAAGILILHSLLKTHETSFMKNIEEKTLKRLAEIASNNNNDFQLRNQVLNFISDLCKFSSSYTHAFWHIGFHQYLLSILNDPNQPILLTAPIEILSKMAVWTTFSKHALLQLGFLDLLLKKLGEPLTIPDQYGVLFGLASIQEPVDNKSNQNIITVEQMYTIFNGVAYHIQNSNLTDQILGEAYRVIGTTMGISGNYPEFLPKISNIEEFCKYTVELLKSRNRQDTRVKIVEFICNAIYQFDEIAQIFLKHDIINIFYDLSNTASEQLILVLLTTISNCIYSTDSTVSYLSESGFLSRSFDWLRAGSIKVKGDALRLFHNILNRDDKFFNSDFAMQVLNKFELLDEFCQFLILDEYESNLLLLTSLTCIYNTIKIYNDAESEMPSPPIQKMLEEDNFEEINRLVNYNEQLIQQKAFLILSEIKPFIPDE
ncbi:hypothetical protein TRFO_21301 [Tritrichomonas foetus]|uniref:Ataxin-10 domain-containing protein n=1 Tax=Tritrichomonas foetus TaxID=1144522 RepID=A0A1J4KE29_9EUKA|nr:hypothetical protein TRFO_21301 [Tritrichomonas foetus]|eukprot:OHT09687.1 hypothetical protein TRFO_21301 [Tritrichomonas foetus]